MIDLLAQSTSSDPSAAAGAMLAAFGLVYLVFIIVMVALYVLIAYNVAKRAGYNPWMGLLILVPLVNFVVLLIFAFSEWPVQREVRALRAQFGTQGGTYAGAGTYAGGGYAADTGSATASIPPPPNPPMTTG